MKLKKALTIIITGGLVLTFSITGFANDNTIGVVKQGIRFAKAHDEMNLKEPMGEKDFEKHIQQFVEKGIISQTQANKWIELCKQQREERKAEIEKIKKMTKEERKAYFTEKHKEKHDPFSAVVEKGIISQEQADQIKEQMPFKHSRRHKKNDREHIQKLVEKEIISQEQADKWIEYSNKQREQRKAEMEKVKSMTKEERKEYFKEMHKTKRNLLSELVTEGIISQEQADLIMKEMPLQSIKSKRNEK